MCRSSSESGVVIRSAMTPPAFTPRVRVLAGGFGVRRSHNVANRRFCSTVTLRQSQRLINVRRANRTISDLTLISLALPGREAPLGGRGAPYKSEAVATGPPSLSLRKCGIREHGRAVLT